MKKNILGQIIFTFIVSLTTSSVFVWTKYKGSIGCLDASQSFYILWFINIGICLLSFLLSLTALLNSKNTIRQNFGTSLLSFIGLPFLVLFSVLILFAVKKDNDDGVSDFLDIGLATLTFCLILLYQFYRFRQKIKSLDA